MPFSEAVCNFTSSATLFPGGALLEGNDMPELTAERAREIFNYDPLTGILTWKKRPRGKRDTSLVAGYVNTAGYLVSGVNKRRYYNHRLVWLMVHGSWPANQIDHINGNKADNTISNLRDATSAVNQQNQRHAQMNNACGLLGVCWVERLHKFKACIRKAGKSIHLGMFQTPEAAHAAYLTAKRQLHAGNTL